MSLLDIPNEILYYNLAPLFTPNELAQLAKTCKKLDVVFKKKIITLVLLSYAMKDKLHDANGMVNNLAGFIFTKNVSYVQAEFVFTKNI